MSPVREELELRLKAFATTHSLPVAYEGMFFKKPDPPAPFLECFLIPALTKNVTVDGTRNREVGLFQVNVWAPAGNGLKVADAIATNLVNAFPVVPKTGLVSIEQTPSKGKMMPDVAGWLIFPVTISYRYES